MNTSQQKRNKIIFSFGRNFGKRVNKTLQWNKGLCTKKSDKDQKLSKEIWLGWRRDYTLGRWIWLDHLMLGEGKGSGMKRKRCCHQNFLPLSVRQCFSSSHYLHNGWEEVFADRQTNCRRVRLMKLEKYLWLGGWEALALRRSRWSCHLGQKRRRQGTLRMPSVQ